MTTSRSLRFGFVMSLTLGRIPLIFIFLVVNLCLIRPVPSGSGPSGLVLGTPETHSLWFGVAFVAMLVSALTDAFDGYFARKFNMVSRFGAYADPLTDKVFYLVAFPTLIFIAALQGDFFHSAVLLGLTIVFLLRDQWVSFLRSIGALYEVSASANWSGKARTIISFPAICIIYWYLLVPADWWLQFPKWFVYFSEIVSLVINGISIWVYSRFYWPWLKKEIKMPDP